MNLSLFIANISQVLKLDKTTHNATSKVRTVVRVKHIATLLVSGSALCVCVCVCVCVVCVAAPAGLYDIIMRQFHGSVLQSLAS